MTGRYGALLHGLTPLQQRRLLSDASWSYRCACRRYGQPYGPITIRDHDGYHAAHRCTTL